MAELKFANPGQDRLDPGLAALLGETAKEFGGLRITSGTRSSLLNRKVGGAKGSYHLSGKAVDLDLRGMDEAARQKLVRSLKARGATGFITYSRSPDMLHVDMRQGVPHFMHDKSAQNIANAPGWFRAIAEGKDMVESAPVDDGKAAKVEAAKRELMRRKAKAELERRRAAKADVPSAGHSNVPEYVPPGVDGYNPETGMVEKTGAGDKVGAFFTSAVEGMPIVGPAVMGGLREGASQAVGAITGEDPAEISDTMERSTRRVQSDNPYTAGGGYLVGAIAPMVAVGGTGIGSRALGMTGNSLMGRTAVSGASNALISGTDTAMRGGDVGDVAQSGGIGGLIGLAIPGAGALTNTIGRAVRDTVGPRINALVRPTREAERRVGAAVSRDAGNVNVPVLNQADEASAALNNQQLLNVDRGGETSRALARSAANADPEARALIERTASERFAGQGDRARSFIDRLAGGPVDDVAVQERLRSAAQAANKPAYKKAYDDGSEVIITPELQRLMGSPAVVQAMKDAIGKGKDRAIKDGFGTFNPAISITDDGRVLFNRVKPGGGTTYPDLQFWDYTKRELDDMANAAARAGRNGEAETIRGIAKTLRGELDTIVPSYKDARAGAAAFFDAEDAIEAGKKFVTLNRQNSEVAAALKKMKPAERAGFAVGFASELKDAIKQSGDRTNVINKIFGSEQSREKVRLALGQKAYKEFESFVRVEHAMDMLRGAMGNSTTARQLMEMGLAGGTVGVGTGLYTGDWTAGLGAAVVTGLARRAGAKVDERVTKRVAELLLSDDPQALKRAVTLATNSPKAAEALKAIQTAIGAALRGVGTDAVRPGPMEITVNRADASANQ